MERIITYKFLGTFRTGLISKAVQEFTITINEGIDMGLAPEKIVYEAAIKIALDHAVRNDCILLKLELLED